MFPKYINNNMKKILLWVLFIVMGSVCHAEDITIHYKGMKAKVEQMVKDSVTVTVEGAHVNITSLYKDHKLTLRLRGKSEDGQLVLKTAGKAKVKLDGLMLTSQEGAPLHLKNKKKVEVTAAKGTTNSLTIAACNDTVSHKASAVWAKDKLRLSGKGTLDIVATGDGCRGIKSKKDITIEELTLHVTTTGNNLGEKPFGFPGMPEGGFPNFGNDSTRRGGFPAFPGGFPAFGNDSTRRGGFPAFPGGFPAFGNDSTRRGGFPGFPGGFPNFGNDSTQCGGMPSFSFDDIPEEVKKQFEEMRKNFNMRPEGGDSTGMGMGGFGGKHKYVAATKGIASKGKITINSGAVTVRTSTAGAEGIEGKEGIVFNGGTIDVLSPDDAINANAVIEFNGAHVTARSTGNDAVDANPQGGFFMPFGNDNAQNIEPAIIIRGGTVYAWSQVGPPEEGLDSDFAPLAIEGGTIFSVGGGMGEMPSVPTNETARQPTALLIGLHIMKDAPVQLLDGDGALIGTITVPFALRRSASLVSSPAFKLGGTYTVKTAGYEKSFTFNEPFMVVR